MPESLPEELSYAQNMGYAQSKLVTENICSLAAEKTGIKARVLRVGQVIGDTRHGIWNDTEAIPIMLQAAITIGAIPRLDESPTWLPVDVVASAIVDVALSDTTTKVMNVVNHRSFSWNEDLLPAILCAGLDFAEVSQKEWVARLRKSNPDPVANPPIKLLEFFASKYDNDRPRKGLKYETQLARSASPALATAPVLDQQLVNKLVKHWKTNCWNKTSISKPSSSPASHLVIIAGPCGSGKSTVARSLSEQYNVPWIKEDSLHSEISVAKMTNGEALLDHDRWAWLAKIKDTALQTMADEQRETVIVTCSALKHEYRQDLRRIGEEGEKRVRITFFQLQATSAMLRRRLDERSGHYMGAHMLDGQMSILEAPSSEETDVIPVDVGIGKEEVRVEMAWLWEDVTMS